MAPSTEQLNRPNDIPVLPRLIAAYYRVSTARQEENQTIESQVGAVKDCAQKGGCEIVQEYRDDGWSGDSLIRPALDQLRVDAKNNARGWDAVLVYDPDRIARRYSYQELVMDELKEAGVEVLFVTTPAPKNMEDRILHGVKGLFAEYERAKITERFRLGKVRKLKDGHILTSEAKYGYTYIPKKDRAHGHYVINEEEANVVRMIFHWVADEGLGLRAVVRRLQEMNIRPRENAQGVWATSTLSTLLHHKVYIGEARWGSSYAVVPDNPLKIDRYRRIKKTSRRKRPEEEWYVTPVPSIIERGIYERAQARLRLNSVMSPRRRQYEYLLAGKIWCICGRRCSGNAQARGKHLYYRCNDRIHCFPLAPSCREKGLNARNADALVWNKLSHLMSSPALMREQAEIWSKSQAERAQSSLGDLAALETEQGRLRDQEDRYNKAYGAGLVSLEQLREYVSPLRGRIAAIEAQANKIKENAGPQSECVMPNEEALKAFTEEAATTLMDLSFSQKRGIVVSAIDKVVATQEKLQIYGFIPLNHVALRSEHRHGQDAIAHLPRDTSSRRIPFYFDIPLPPPLKTGVDYGFKRKKEL